jgi:hypothetical protein
MQLRIHSVTKLEPDTFDVALVAPGIAVSASLEVHWSGRPGAYDASVRVLSVDAPRALAQDVRDWLDAHEDEVADAAYHGHVERACECCRVLTRSDVLVDASEFGAFAGEWCPDCVALADCADHAEACPCTSCARVREQALRQTQAREAAVRGGLSKSGLHALAWVEE